MLHFDEAPRKPGLYALLELLDSGGSVLAVEAAGIVHQDNMSRDRMAEYGFQLGGQAVFVALQAGPAVISRIQPEQGRLPERAQKFRYHALAVAFPDMNMRPAREFFLLPLRQPRIKFHRMDLIEPVPHRRHHLTVVGAGFHQDPQTAALSVFPYHVLLPNVRRAIPLAAQLS